ncbi:MAG: hypothetical protein WCJ18_00025 [Planctomycetota bacterium]
MGYTGDKTTPDAACQVRRWSSRLRTSVFPKVQLEMPRLVWSHTVKNMFREMVQCVQGRVASVTVTANAGSGCRPETAALERQTRMLGTLLERTARIDGDLASHEFQVYSQWGEDGILSFLVNLLDPLPQNFVEFGVENYLEANTRWLLCHRNWRGLVIDGSVGNVQQIRASDLSWRHDLTAVQAFVTRDNINHLLSSQGFSGPIGILSIDIDGVDFWVWERIDTVEPVIVVVEYNSLFGPDRCVTVPYSEFFVRHEAHHSTSYYGASLAALVALGRKKGYCFVGSNTAGNNAFFVKQDRMKPPLRERTASEGYVRRAFREARDADGRLMLPTFEQEAALIAALPLVDVAAFCSSQAE